MRNENCTPPEACSDHARDEAKAGSAATAFLKLEDLSGSPA